VLHSNIFFPPKPEDTQLSIAIFVALAAGRSTVDPALLSIDPISLETQNNESNELADV